MTTNEDVAKMAALAVRAELKFRDGLREKISVTAENNLSSLLHALHELNGNVSRLLSELVEREKAQGGCAAAGDEEDSDEEDSDEEEEEPEDPVNSDRRPPAKRLKT